MTKQNILKRVVQVFPELRRLDITNMMISKHLTLDGYYYRIELPATRRLYLLDHNEFTGNHAERIDG